MGLVDSQSKQRYHMIKFKCNTCNKESQKDPSSFYKQRKKFGYNLCRKCGIKLGVVHTIKTKYSNKRNSDIIQCPCERCGTIRTIRRASSKLSNICRSCANSEKSKKLWADEAFRNKASIRTKHQWLENHDIMSEKFRSDSHRTKLSRISKKLWARNREKLMKMYTLDFRNKLSQLTKKQWAEPEYIAKMKLLHQNSEFRKKMSIISKKSWETNKDQKLMLLHSPQVLSKLRDKCKTVEFKQKVSINTKKLWQSQEYRDKMWKIWHDEEFIKRQAIVRANRSPGSKQQDILYAILDDYGIRYIKEFPIGFYAFDCLIPKQGDMQRPLLIEVQGDYWHSLPGAINRDKSKATYLRTYFPEYDLKYLWEHEFNNKDRVENLLKYWLGIFKCKLIQFDFDDIEEKNIEYKEAEIFISKHHYAGRIRSGINIGYFLGDELIAVIIYQHPVRLETANKQNLAYKQILELSRLAIHPKYQVKNLASNLVSRSIRFISRYKLEVKMLISFADSTYNHLGTVYKATNWDLDGEVDPDYWYVDDKGYVCHKKTLWNHAKSLRMTENEYCKRYDYNKIWGGKKLRYIYRLSSKWNDRL